jgi:hypothetical protein
MGVHSIEVAGAIDVGPGVYDPLHLARCVAVFLEHPVGRFIRHFVHVPHERLAGLAAELQFAEFGMPSPTLVLAALGAVAS